MKYMETDMEHIISYTVLALIIAFLLWQNRNMTLFIMAKNDTPALHNAKQIGAILKKKKKDDSKSSLGAEYNSVLASGVIDDETIKRLGSEDGVIK